MVSKADQIADAENNLIFLARVEIALQTVPGFQGYLITPFIGSSVWSAVCLI